MDFRPDGCGCKGKVPEIVCPFCDGPGCRNGYRIVKAQVRVGEDGRAFRVEGMLRARYRCRHCRRSWTVLESGGFPHRTYTPAVEAAAVDKLSQDPEATLSSVARTFQCDRRTVGRWVRQTQEAADPGRPGGIGFQWSRVGLAGLLALLEHLADLLRAQRFSLEPGRALASLLRWQFDHFRIVAYLARASPPLPITVALALG